MAKILFAVNALEYNKNNTDFVQYICSLTESSVTAIFLEHFPAAASISEIDTIKSISEKNIAAFRQHCEQKGLKCSVKRHASDLLKETVSETRYADMLIIDPSTGFKDDTKQTPSSFVKDILKTTECPVLLSPAHCEDIEEVIFTYDGTSSCIFSIKQFTYLFPALDDKKVSVVHVKGENEKTGLEYNRFKNWIKEYYSSIGFTELHGDTFAELLTYLAPRKNSMVVMGSYGRSAVSEFFRKSTSEALINTVPHAFFITHF